MEEGRRGVAGGGEWRTCVTPSGVTATHRGGGRRGESGPHAEGISRPEADSSYGHIRHGQIDSEEQRPRGVQVNAPLYIYSILWRTLASQLSAQEYLNGAPHGDEEGSHPAIVDLSPQASAFAKDPATGAEWTIVFIQAIVRDSQVKVSESGG